MTPEPLRTPTVLIVDDERHNRDLLGVMLAADSFILLKATDGESALAVVAETPPDLILLDIMMPGMDGYEVARRLKQDPATRSIPVIMLTALNDLESRMRALTAGAEDCLSKPVSRDELRLRMRNLLRLKFYSDYHDEYSQMLEGQIELRAADLIESEALYRSTFHEAPVGIVHIGLDGTWLRVNRCISDLLGYDEAELLSEPVQLLEREEDMPGEREALRDLAAGFANRFVIDEKRYRRRDGTFLWARVNLSVHRGADGQARHFIAVIEDVSERRALEMQIRQAGKMDAVGRLASGVAHDFNNLLTVILGCAEFVASDEHVARDHAEDMGEVIKAANRAAGLTRQLLAFGRQQVLRTEPLDVNLLVRDMSGMLGRLIGEDITIVHHFAPDLALALGDRGQLEQVVMNLTVNARDAMPDGGTLTIETANVELENSAFQEEAVHSGKFVMIAITDTGVGMSRDTQARLFEPFFTTKPAGHGTGLGLATTYGIVKQSKGFIWVYSEPGLGTTFKVYLPRTSVTEPAQPAETPLYESATRPTETVLLVEDEEAVRRLTRRILGNAGYRVLEASNGEEAFSVYTHHKGVIDLVITDVVMPGVGGPELVRRLQIESPFVRALYMSGYTERTVAHKIGLDQDVRFVQKPFTGPELLHRVSEALRGRPEH